MYIKRFSLLTSVFLSLFFLMLLILFISVDSASAQSNLFNNPNFDTDLSGWVVNGYSWSAGGAGGSGGHAHIDGTSGAPSISQDFLMSASGSYYLEFHTWNNVFSGGNFIHWTRWNGASWAVLSDSSDINADIACNVPLPESQLFFYPCAFVVDVPSSGTYRLTLAGSNYDNVSLVAGSPPVYPTATPVPTSTPAPTSTPVPPVGGAGIAGYPDLPVGFFYAEPDTLSCVDISSGTGTAFATINYPDLVGFGVSGSGYTNESRKYTGVSCSTTSSYSASDIVGAVGRAGAEQFTQWKNTSGDCTQWTPGGSLGVSICSGAYFAAVESSLLESHFLAAGADHVRRDAVIDGASFSMRNRSSTNNKRPVSAVFDADDVYLIIAGVPPTPTPVPPPASGFGASCDYSGTITNPLTTTITISSSLLIDGSFENSIYNWSRPDGGYFDTIGGIGGSYAWRYATGGEYSAWKAEYQDMGASTSLCQHVVLPTYTASLLLGADIIASESLTGSRAINLSYFDIDITGGIVAGSSTPFDTTWENIEGSHAFFGTSSGYICIDFELGNSGAFVDRVYAYAYDSNQSLICPHSDNFPAPVIQPTVTPDIWAGATPVVLPTAVSGGMSPIVPAVGITPQPTRCLGWVEADIPSITNTVPALEICLELNEVDLSSVDASLDLPFSFSSLASVFLSIAIAFTVVGLVRNR